MLAMLGPFGCWPVFFLILFLFFWYEKSGGGVRAVDFSCHCQNINKWSRINWQKQKSYFWINNHPVWFRSMFCRCTKLLRILSGAKTSTLADDWTPMDFDGLWSSSLPVAELVAPVSSKPSWNGSDCWGKLSNIRRRSVSILGTVMVISCPLKNVLNTCHSFVFFGVVQFVADRLRRMRRELRILFQSRFPFPQSGRSIEFRLRIEVTWPTGSRLQTGKVQFGCADSTRQENFHPTEAFEAAARFRFAIHHRHVQWLLDGRHSVVQH